MLRSIRTDGLAGLRIDWQRAAAATTVGLAGSSGQRRSGRDPNETAGWAVAEGTVSESP